MILVLGALSNPSVAHVCLLLSQRGDEFLLLDVRHYPEHFDLTWEWGESELGGDLRWDGRAFPIRDIRSIYVHQIEDPATHTRLESDGLPPRTSLAYGVITGFVNSFSGLVINSPNCCGSNTSKPFQQQQIARAGFLTPRSLITNLPDEAVRFLEECRGRLITKSASGERSVVTRLVPDDLASLERIRLCPTHFQEAIPGTDVRVHVVGNEVFATEIECDATDYRYVSRDGTYRTMRPIQLEHKLEHRCLDLARRFGMHVAGIDLRRDPAGNIYCFEVNPAPGFAFYQAETQQPIGESLVSLLCAEERSSSVSRNGAS